MAATQVSHPRPYRPARALAAGYLVLEALCGFAMLGAGLLPLALASRPASAWARDQRALAEAIAVAGEAAELAGLRVAPGAGAPGQQPRQPQQPRPADGAGPGMRICGIRDDGRPDPACPPDRAHEISIPLPGDVSRATSAPTSRVGGMLPVLPVSRLSLWVVP